MNDQTDVDRYAVWRDAADAGTPIPADKLHVDHPLPGFYAYKSRTTGEYVPVAYWPDGEGLACLYGKKILTPPRSVEIWPWCARRPVTHEAYTFRMENDRWQWENEVAHNDRRNAKAPEETTEKDLDDRIAKLKIEAEALIAKGGAPSQNEADRAADLAELLQDLETFAEERRTVLKKPHWDAGKAVDAIWTPLRDAASSLKNRLKGIVINPFLSKRNAELAAAHQEALDRQLSTDTPMPVAPPPKAKAGTGARRVGQRNVVSAEITDLDAFFQAVKSNEKVIAVLQDVANGIAKTGTAVAGMKILNDSKAV